MAYIGNQPTSAPFVTDTYTGTGSQTAFLNLTFAPAAPSAIAVYVNGAYQTPATDYTVSGTTLNFVSAPAGSAEIVVLHLGVGSSTVTTVADAVITTAKIANDAVTSTKIADGSITTTKIADGNVTTAKLADTTVTPGVYGSGDATQIPLITIDAKGRITQASNTTLVVPEAETFPHPFLFLPSP